MRHHFFFLLFLLLPLGATAQVGEHRNDFAVGLNSGYVMNRVTFNPSVKETPKGGLTLGAIARYTCEKYFSAICAVQAELNYASLGWEEDIDPAYSTDTYSRTMHYIQMPLLTRIAWGRERRGAQFYLLLGPQFGYCIGEKEHFSNPWIGSPRPNNVTMQYGKAIENRFEYGLTGGAGLEISTAIGHFQLEGRYYFALSDMYGNSKKDPFGRSANGAIFIKAAYLLDLIRTKNDAIK
ncbi:MAG: PorT family protein [Bacteroidaceae bacterium]|nr:PorT family protein [Bacteroidaceae bacterium]